MPGPTEIHHGDCLDVMATFDAGSVDAIVTDPPYGLEFMGKEWDRLDGVGKSTVPLIAEDERDSVYGRTGRVSYYRSNNRRCATCGHWEWSGTPCRCDKPDFPSPSRTMQEWHHRWVTAALRVAKPGAYLLAFGGTRTYHRLVVAIEDAGWIIRDCLVWAYASGFPKSRALLKPAWEPIVMARKPGPLRELAIDECRIGTSKGVPASVSDARDKYGAFAGRPEGSGGMDPAVGRWPANVVLTDPVFDGGWEGVVGGGEARVNRPGQNKYATEYYGKRWSSPEPPFGYGDSGTYSRFFLVPKAGRADREPSVAGDTTERVVSVWGGDEDDLTPGKKSTVPRRNTHPTVKPVELMRHLVRLVTPPGGTVLDPFLGSGTTALAAEQEGRAWIGIEREAEYVAIAKARLRGNQHGLGLTA